MAFARAGLSKAQIASNSVLASINDIYNRVADTNRTTHNLVWGHGNTGIAPDGVSGPTGAHCLGANNYYSSGCFMVGVGSTGSSGACMFGAYQHAYGSTGSPILLGNGCTSAPTGATGHASPMFCVGGDLEPAAQWARDVDFNAHSDAVAVQIPIVYQGVKYWLAGRIAGPADSS